MSLEAFGAWLVAQAVGPEIVGSGLRALGKRSWRAKLVRRVRQEAGEGVPRRRLKVWLSNRTTWNDLVELTPAAVERLTVSLAAALRPRVPLLPRRKKSSAQLREEAERVVPTVVGELLAALDPSLAASVAHYREMGELRDLKGKVEHIAEVLDVDRDMDALVRRLPPTATGPVETLRRDSRSACTALLKSVFGEAAGPRVATAGLIRVPPQWLQSGPPSAWLTLAELASAHGEHDAASTAFEEAAERGSPNRSVCLARAAAEAATAEDMQRADHLLDAAKKLEDGGSQFVGIVDAALREDYEDLTDLADAYPDGDPHREFVIGVRGNAYLALKRWDNAIETLDEQLRLQPRAAGAYLRIAQALLARVTEGKSDSRQADLRRAREFALKARDLRRVWLGPSDEAVAIACRAAIAAHAWEEAIGLGREFPEGQATPEEAASQEVLPLVAAAAIVTRRLDIAEGAVDRITDPFEMAYQSVQLGEGRRRPREQLVAEYRKCWELARTPEQRFAVQMGLASVGEWPIEGIEDLEREHPEQAEIVTAFSESERNLHDQAISRLRKWPESSRAQELLANLYGEAGRVQEAIDTFREAHRRFDEPLFSVKAVQLLGRSGRVDEAEREAKSALASVPEGSSAGVELRRLLIELAASRGDWGSVEALSRALVSEDEADSDSRWWLVLALQNQGRVDQAWRSLTTPEHLWPTTEIQARLWLDLHRRFGKGASTVQKALQLASEYEASEEVFAAALLTVYEVSREDTLPEQTVADVHRATESFLARFPESQLFRKIEFADVDELIAQVREFVEPGAAQFEELAKSVIRRWFPYVVLSAFVGRPYTEGLLKRAAGCLTQEVQESVILESELHAVEEAIDAEVIVDPSVLATFGLFPEHWSVVLAAFSRISIATPAHHDIQSARAALAIKSTMSVGWDTKAGKPRIDEISQQAADELANRSEWIARSAAALSLIDVRELEDFPGLEFERYAAALAGLQAARAQGFPLFAADAGLRLLAHSMGTPTFGVLSLLQVLEARGNLPSESLVAITATLRRQFVVDVETTKEEAIALAEEDDWRLGPGAYLMTRPAFWRDRQTALDVYKLACHRVVSRSREALPGWVSSAVYGAASGEGPDRVAVLAGILATYAILAAEFDANAFAQLLGPVRSAVEDLGGPDPLPAIVGQLMGAFRERFHPQLAARFMLAVASGLPESDRLTVLQLILAKGPDESR